MGEPPPPSEDANTGDGSVPAHLHYAGGLPPHAPVPDGRAASVAPCSENPAAAAATPAVPGTPGDSFLPKVFSDAEFDALRLEQFDEPMEAGGAADESKTNATHSLTEWEAMHGGGVADEMLRYLDDINLPDAVQAQLSGFLVAEFNSTLPPAAPSPEQGTYPHYQSPIGGGAVPDQAPPSVESTRCRGLPANWLPWINLLGQKQPEDAQLLRDFAEPGGRGGNKNTLNLLEYGYQEVLEFLVFECRRDLDKANRLWNKHWSRKRQDKSRAKQAKKRKGPTRGAKPPPQGPAPGGGGGPQGPATFLPCQGSVSPSPGVVPESPVPPPGVVLDELQSPSLRGVTRSMSATVNMQGTAISAEAHTATVTASKDPNDDEIDSLALEASNLGLEDNDDDEGVTINKDDDDFDDDDFDDELVGRIPAPYTSLAHHLRVACAVAVHLHTSPKEFETLIKILRNLVDKPQEAKFFRLHVCGDEPKPLVRDVWNNLVLRWVLVSVGFDTSDTKPNSHVKAPQTAKTSQAAALAIQLLTIPTAEAAS